MTYFKSGKQTPSNDDDDDGYDIESTIPIPPEIKRRLQEMFEQLMHKPTAEEKEEQKKRDKWEKEQIEDLARADFANLSDENLGALVHSMMFHISKKWSSEFFDACPVTVNGIRTAMIIAINPENEDQISPCAVLIHKGIKINFNQKAKNNENIEMDIVTQPLRNRNAKRFRRRVEQDKH